MYDKNDNVICWKEVSRGWVEHPISRFQQSNVTVWCLKPTWLPRENRLFCKIVTWWTGLKIGPLRGLKVGNIIYTIRLIQQYIVTEILLCGLGSLVSEWHLLFPKARTPTTPRLIYATQCWTGSKLPLLNKLISLVLMRKGFDKKRSARKGFSYGKVLISKGPNKEIS